MLISELVNSESELLDTVTSILLRAKSEGVKTIDMRQLINDLGDPNLTPELMVDLLDRNTGKLKNIVSASTVDEVELNDGSDKKRMVSKAEKTSAEFNKVAVQQARDNLK